MDQQTEFLEERIAELDGFVEEFYVLAEFAGE